MPRKTSVNKARNASLMRWSTKKTEMVSKDQNNCPQTQQCQQSVSEMENPSIIPESAEKCLLTNDSHEINEQEHPNESLVKPNGRRLFSINAIEMAMNSALEHSKICCETKFLIIDEKRKGLETIIFAKCSHCMHTIGIENETYDCSLPANEAAIWAGNADGVGFSAMENIMTLFDVPFLSFKSYAAREEKFHESLKVVATDILVKNGLEERQKAIELGWIDQNGIAYTTVEGDCAWSKRSYNHKGNSKSGSVVLIGALTKKPLFQAVRISYCLICSVKPEKMHKCYKNWDKSASEMEPDMVLEGFNKSMTMHNLRYQRYLGDGDSSVFQAIRLVYYTQEHNFTIVEKIECVNHAIRRTNSNINDILVNTSYPIQHRRKLGEVVSEIGKACVYAIAQNSANRCTSSNATYLTLRYDLNNVLDHSLGNHAKCKPLFCVDKKLVVPDRYKKDDYEPKDPLDNLMNDATDKEVPYIVLKETAVYQECSKIIGRLAILSRELIHGLTTNLSEGYFGQFAKFLSGKRTNVILRGGYHSKSLETLCASMYGSGWYTPVIKMATGRSPSSQMKTIHGRRIRARQIAKKRKRKPRCKKSLFSKDSSVPLFFSKSKKYDGNKDYGPNANKPDIDNDILKHEITDYISKREIKDNIEQWIINEQTIGQFNNDKYKVKKRHMITASVAGELFHLRNSTPNTRWLDKLLYNYPSFKEIAATSWGTEKELVARAKYAKDTGLHISQSGLFVSTEHPLLGASPDGLIGSDGILEIKCPYTERFANVSLVAKRENSKCPFLYEDQTSSSIKLMRTCHYYYQVVMQLHVTNREWCDFVVWTQGPLDEKQVPVDPEGQYLVDRIYKDNDTLLLWKRMKSKFLTFINEDMLPEIIDSRLDRNMGFRQPEYRTREIEKAAKRKSLRKPSLISSQLAKKKANQVAKKKANQVAKKKANQVSKKKANQVAKKKANQLAKITE